MPELPEVETIRQVLDEYLPRHIIRTVYVKRARMLRGQSLSSFRRRLLNQTVRKVERRAKYLLIRLQQDTLLVHLGMSGQIFVTSKSVSEYKGLPQLPDKHTHFWLGLSRGLRVYFRDPRMFGRFGVFTPQEEKRFFADIGPEPLDCRFTPELFYRILCGRTTPIKAALLNQNLLAGLGNIYTDEALFRAGILPQTPSGQLTRQQVKKLHTAIRNVLKNAIRARGTSISDFYDPRHQPGTFQLKLRVYGRENEECYKCHAKICKAVVAGRGTHWCPDCQT